MEITEKNRDRISGVNIPFSAVLVQLRESPILAVVIDQRFPFAVALCSDDFRDEQCVHSGVVGLNHTAVHPGETADDQWRAGHERFNLHTGEAILYLRRAPREQIRNMTLLLG